MVAEVCIANIQIQIKMKMCMAISLDLKYAAESPTD